MRNLMIPLFAMTLFSASLHAETTQHGAVHGGSVMTDAAKPDAATQNSAMTGSAVMSDGEVRKIDPSTGKITLKHGPIPNLDMPGMTMVFRAQQADLLNNLKKGDKVRFHAEEINGNLTVTAIEKVR